ncbi:MAG: elongation factor G [Bacillota bacterium]|nr:MAG: elongation factor G [Bacillota bacterium]
MEIGGFGLKQYDAQHIRNIALTGHGGSGKTQLTEAMLFATGALSRMGKVDDGNTVSDWDPEEAKRQVSIGTSLVPCEWKDHKINVLDTPGYFDFVGEVESALAAADAMLCVVCAASGVEVGTEQAWAMADKRSLPRAFFVNKMDRENASFERTVEQIRSTFGADLAVLQVPIGEAAAFRGWVDLLTMEAWVKDGDKMTKTDVPDEVAAMAESYRESLVEAVAATDDELTLLFLEDEPIETEDLVRALGQAVRSGALVPVWLGSALQGLGADALMDGIVRFLPSPLDGVRYEATDVKSGETVTLEPDPNGPLAAFVFKTISDPFVGRLTLFRVVSGTFSADGTVRNIDKDKDERVTQVFVLRGKEQIAVPAVSAGDLGAVSKLQVTATGDSLGRKERPFRFPKPDFPKPVLTMALVPKAKGDEDRIAAGLARMQEEDVTFAMSKDAESGQILVSGMGELQLEIMTTRLKSQFGVEVDLVPPKIPYRETIRGKVEQEGRHKKQTGGRGQFGHVFLRLEPLPPGGGFEFVDEIFGGAVPKQYIPAVEKGVEETMAEGVLAGYPVVDVKVTLYDGSYHSVDSSEMAFKIAASMAFKEGFMKAQPVLLEPVLQVEVVVPERFMGDVIADLNKKRGRILGMDPDGGNQIIRAHVPMAEMARYAVDLRSITQGRGRFKTELAHYEEVPEHLAAEIISQAQAAKGAS